jgi:signal peptidase I
MTSKDGPARAKTSRTTDRLALIAVSLAGFILFLGVASCLPGTGFVYRLYNITAGSMIPTLKVGNYVLVSRAAYGYSRYSFDLVSLPIEGRFPMIAPQRGDVVIFKLPRDGRTDFIQRVVGMPADQIQMVNGRLIINGTLVERELLPKIKTKDFSGKPIEVPTYRESLRDGESHTIIEIQGDTGFNDNTKLFDVPQGQYFVMGDNRDRQGRCRIRPAGKFCRPGCRDILDLSQFYAGPPCLPCAEN